MKGFRRWLAIGLASLAALCMGADFDCDFDDDDDREDCFFLCFD